jgi:hypothetical protein
MNKQRLVNLLPTRFNKVGQGSFNLILRAFSRLSMSASGIIGYTPFEAKWLSRLASLLDGLECPVNKGYKSDLRNAHAQKTKRDDEEGNSEEEIEVGWEEISKKERESHR